jgi:mono/diheme cytochrome c family protein
MKTTAVAAALFLLLVGPALSADGPQVRATAEGKALFESRCSRCHEIERPLARDMSRAEWEKLLIDMTSRGAEMDNEEKNLILDYLAARFVFTSKCTVCHTKERILDRERARRDWVATVEAMSAKSPDLLTESEADAIISYLNLVLGPSQ